MNLSILLTMVILITACSTGSSHVGWDDAFSAEKQARKMLSEARETVTEARDLRGLWRDTEAHLSKAEEALAQGRYQIAVSRAQIARDEARLAINQAYLERAKFRLREIRSRMDEAGTDQKDVINQIQRDIHLGKGRSVYDQVMDFHGNINEDKK